LLPDVIAGIHFSLKINICDQSFVSQRIISDEEEDNAYNPLSM
jgi:hypothetical protein